MYTQKTLHSWLHLALQLHCVVEVVSRCTETSGCKRTGHRTVRLKPPRPWTLISWLAASASASCFSRYAQRNQRTSCYSTGMLISLSAATCKLAETGETKHKDKNVILVWLCTQCTRRFSLTMLNSVAMHKRRNSYKYNQKYTEWTCISFMYQ